MYRIQSKVEPHTIVSSGSGCHLPILRDQVQHLIGADDATASPVLTHGAGTNLANDPLDLRSGHSMAHADVLEDVLYALSGDRPPAAIDGGGMDYLFLKSLREFLRVAAIEEGERCGVRPRGALVYTLSCKTTHGRAMR